MRTYREVADAVGLKGKKRKRYISYIKDRWEESEESKCKSGYAEEWAWRFYNEVEYLCSDDRGLAILEQLDKW